MRGLLFRVMPYISGKERDKIVPEITTLLIALNIVQLTDAAVSSDSGSFD